MKCPKKINIVFPVGKTPEVKLAESSYVEKDAYVFWDMECSTIPSCFVPKAESDQKEILCINSLIKRVERLEEELINTENLVCERCQDADYKCKDCLIHQKRIKEESRK